MANAIRLQPSLREKVWGRTQLSPWFPDSAEKIGEAWYLTGRELPLLVKLIFTSERLSVQVHPDDGEDGPRGKTEMWHILAADPGATIALGFREPITRERLREATLSGEIEHLVNWVPVKAGETYFTPAHTVHAIGAGIVLTLGTLWLAKVGDLELPMAFAQGTQPFLAGEAAKIGVATVAARFLRR